MGILAPDAVIKLWNEMLDEGRKTGFSMKDSQAFIDKINLQQEFNKNTLLTTTKIKLS